MENERRPGVSRSARISVEGLERLERQLQNGATMSAPVKQQWIKRYGNAAVRLFEKYGVSVG